MVGWHLCRWNLVVAIQFFKDMSSGIWIRTSHRTGFCQKIFQKVCPKIFQKNMSKNLPKYLSQKPYLPRFDYTDGTINFDMLLNWMHFWNNFHHYLNCRCLSWSRGSVSALKTCTQKCTVGVILWWQNHFFFHIFADIKISKFEFITLKLL